MARTSPEPACQRDRLTRRSASYAKQDSGDQQQHQKPRDGKGVEHLATISLYRLTHTGRLSVIDKLRFSLEILAEK